MTLLVRTRHQRPSFVGVPLDRLGIFTTQGELEIWNQRARGQDQHNFNTSGASWTNSPNDWGRIVNQKNRLMGSYTPWQGPTYDWPNKVRWASEWTVGGGLRPHTIPPQKNEQGAPEPMKHGAFWAMVLGSVHLDPSDRTITANQRDTVLAQVKTDLLSHTTTQYLDFSRTHRWDPNDSGGNSFRPGDNNVHYFIQLVSAYDFAQIANPDIWSDAEKKTFIDWLWSCEPTHGTTGSRALVHRRRDGVISVSTGLGIGDAGDPSTVNGIGMWNGSGKELYVHHEVDNHVKAFTAYFCCVAVLAELEMERSPGVSFDSSSMFALNATKIEKGKEFGRWMAKAYLQNEVAASVGGNSGGQGSGPRMGSGNMYRGLLQNTAQGWKYSMEWLSGTLIGADVLARAGEETTYELSYTTGVGGHNGGFSTAGSIPTDTYFNNPGPKTLHRALQQMMRYIIETGSNSHPWRFAHGSSTETKYRIDSRAGDGNEGNVHSKEYEMMPFFLRYNDSKLQDIYTRAASGTPNHPSNPTSPHWWVEDGAHGMQAGACFQYAFMEGRVNPYPGAS